MLYVVTLDKNGDSIMDSTYLAYKITAQLERMGIIWVGPKPLSEIENKYKNLFLGTINELEEKFPVSSFPYHNAAHTRQVVLESLLFLESSSGSNKITEEQVLDLFIAALFHDIIQNFEWREILSGGIAYQRIRANTNEEVSFHSAVQRLKESGVKLSQEREDGLEKLILVTQPQFSLKEKTVIQPRLTRNSSIEEFAIAAADIAVCGYNTEQYMRDGLTLFRENNRLIGLNHLEQDKRSSLRSTLIGWLHGQVLFVDGQCKLWRRSFIPSGIKNRLTMFTQSRRAAKRRWQMYRDTSLEELLDLFGFTSINDGLTLK